MSTQAVVLHVRPESASDGGAERSLGLDWPVRTVRSREAALSALAETDVAAVVVDHAPDSGLDGLPLLEAVRADWPALPVVLCTDRPDGRVAAAATRLDVSEYVPRSETEPGDRLAALLGDPTPPGGDSASHAPVTIADSIPVALLTIDADSRITYANDAAAGLTGYDRGSLTGMSFLELLPAERRSEYRDTVRAYLESGERSLDWESLEVPLLTATGDRIPGVVALDEFEQDGEWFCTAVVQDVSGRKSRERELEQNNEHLQRLTQLAASDELTEDEILERVLEIGADRLGLSLGYLSRIDGDDYEVVSVVGDHDVIQAGTSTDLGNTYCRRIADGADQFGVRDAAADGFAGDPAYEMSGIACYLGGKVVVDDELYGTLCFADEQPRSAPFSESEQTFTKLLAEWTSRELERRRQTDDLERYETVIEAVDDGIYALDETGHFELVNDAMTDLTGYEASELLGSHTSFIKDDEVVERAETIVRSMIFDDRDDDEATFDLEILRADGTSFPAEDHMTLVWDEDREWFEGTAGIVRDITERKERELELREAHHRIERILDRIGAAFFAVDDDWELTYWNTRAEEVLGRPAEAVVGENLWEVFPDAVDATFYSAYHEAMDSQEPAVFEEYYPPVGKWFRVNAYPSSNGLSVYFHDITDQKERDRKLSGLLETTRSLMQAHTPEAVAQTVVDAAEAELGFDLNLVRLYDEETGTLVPAAATDGMPERPVYDAEEAFPGEAYQRGETVRVDDFDVVENYDDQDAKAAMYVPLDGHGVLSVATYEKATFDDADVSVAEILASNAAAALDRVEREQDLLRYETVMENVRDMVYVLDQDGRFQLVTEPLAEWLGYERSELVGRHPRTVFDEQSVGAFDDHIRDLRANDDAGRAQIETTLYTADGTERPVEIEVSLIDEASFSGTAGVVRDRTELERTREELRDERDRFSYLFNNLPDAVVETEVTDDGSLVRSVNPAFTEVFGFDQGAVLDDDLNEFILPPDDRARDKAHRLDAQSAEGESVQAELRRRTADGFRDFLFRGVPYRRDDGRLWSFGIYTDITDQKERERRLEVLNRVLRHNLRNDLTVVLGLADELYERIDDESHRSLLGQLQGKAEQIASLSDRARDIERSVRREDAGTEPLDVPETVARLVDQFATQYDTAIEMSLPATSVRAADGRFGRVLSELLENSLEHAGEDPSVSVSVEVAPETVVVTVADDGPGIPAHELDVLTGTEPITQLSHGSGLGLWLVIWVTESYGGTVSFENDGGATVRLSLPRTDR